jgi:hypothetical protein
MLKQLLPTCRVVSVQNQVEGCMIGEWKVWFSCDKLKVKQAVSACIRCAGQQEAAILQMRVASRHSTDLQDGNLLFSPALGCAYCRSMLSPRYSTVQLLCSLKPVLLQSWLVLYTSFHHQSTVY